MKKYLSTILILSLVLGLLGFGIAQSLKPYTFLFSGRWQAAENALLIEGDGFQDIQNLRRSGKGLKGVSGHSKINEIIINSTYYYPRNAFHFKKANPSESHILVASYDAAQSNSRVYTNDVVPPYKGEFTSTALFSSTGSPGKARFSNAPQGSIIYSNANEQKIWGGNDIQLTSFITSTAAVTNSVTNAKDYTNVVTNTNVSDTATVNQASNGYWLIGTPRVLQGLKYHLSSANTSSATMTVKVWSGTAWNTLATTDNTSGLSDSGTITWDADTTTELKYLEGYVLYWYQSALSAGSADIYNITADAPFQSLKNVWAGEEVVVAGAKKYSSTGYTDYTDEVNDDTTTFVFTADSLATNEYIYLGFLESQQGFNIWMPAGKENTTAATTLTTKYWNGAGWSSVSAQNDGTSSSSISLAQSGTVSFQSIAKGTEFRKQLVGEDPLFYYQLGFDKVLDLEVEIYYITGIPNTYPISNYRFSELFQKRAFLLCDQKGEKNKALYSAFMTPNVFNGDDSGELWFGGDEELTAAGVLYNVYENLAVSQLIVTKKNETYRVFGDGPENWEVQRMSGSIGCTAPQSMVVCEIAGNRNFAIWQASHGFVMSDGATIQTISDDIACYFDQNDSRYITERKIADTVAWFDPNTNTYHALVSTSADFDIADTWGGSDIWETTYADAWGMDWEESLVTHNLELEYSLRYQEWTKIYREDSSGARPLHVGFQVRSNRGKIYTYGMADNGYMYHLENGKTWAGTSITQYVHTKNLLLDPEKPFWDHSLIEYMRIIHEQKSTGDGEDIDIAHYCEDTLTVTAVSDQVVPVDIDMATDVYNTQDCTLGPCLYHSFLFTSVISTVYDGMELLGVALYYDDFDTIFE